MNKVMVVLLLASGCTTGGRAFGSAALVSATVAIATAPSPFEEEGGHKEVAAGTAAAISLVCALTSLAFEIFAEPASSESPTSLPPLSPPPPSITMRDAGAFVAPAARDPQATRFTEQAYFAARVGHCTAVKTLADRVHSLDASYFSSVFAVEPTIATCCDAPVIARRK